MPAALEPPPAPVAPTITSSPAAPAPAAPAASPVQPSPTGSESFVQEMENMISPPTPPVKPGEPVKPAEPQPPAPVAPPPPPKPVDPGTKDPKALRVRLAEIEAKYAGLEQTTANEKRELQEKIAAFEKRKWLTPEQEQQYAAVENRAKELEAELYSRDIREDPSFKERYQVKWAKRYDQAKREIGLITVEGPEGEPRQAGELDLKRILDLRDNPILQQETAEELFGKHANRIINHVNALTEIEQAANEEIATARATYAQKRQQMLKESEEFGSTFAQVHAGTQSELEKKYPQYFAKDPSDPEATNALQHGLDFIENTMKELPVQTKAARSALIRAWAAAFPRMVLIVNRLEAKVQERDNTIAQLQGTDPGEGGEGGGVGGGNAQAKGVDELTKEFDQLPQ